MVAMLVKEWYHISKKAYHNEFVLIYQLILD